jgi:fucose 4-O-acetylase-like acetyltransferase
MKERLWHFENAKVVLILLVVLGHFLAPALESYKTVYQFIYIFHMPCFIFISGYFSKKGITLLDAFCKYLAPYLVFQIFYLALSHFLRTPSGGSSIIEYITVPFHALWYLLCLFFFTLMLNFVDKTRIKGILLLSFVASLLILFIPANIFAASRTLFFFPFFLLGYYAKKTGLSLIGSKQEKLIFLLFFACVYFLCTIYQFDKKLLSGTTPLYKIGIDVVSGISLRSVLIILSVIGCFGLVKLMPAGKTLFSKYGSRTFQIFIFHDIAVRFFLFFHVYNRFHGVNLTLLIVVSTILTFYLSSFQILGDFISYISRITKSLIQLINRRVVLWLSYV